MHKLRSAVIPIIAVKIVIVSFIMQASGAFSSTWFYLGIYANFALMGRPRMVCDLWFIEQ